MPRRCATATLSRCSFRRVHRAAPASDINSPHTRRRPDCWEALAFLLERAGSRVEGDIVYHLRRFDQKFIVWFFLSQVATGG